MEMCVDNPREGFADLFATHPSVDARVAALIKFAGGHDPGPIALPPPGEAPELGGPWGAEAGQAADQSGAPVPGYGAEPGKPFLPERPPVELGGEPPDAGRRGPWGGSR